MNFILFIVDDNRNVMKVIANKISVPLIGYAGYRFNLDVQYYLDVKFNLIVLKIKDLMRKLSTLKERGKPRKTTTLAPIVYNKTVVWKNKYDKALF